MKGRFLRIVARWMLAVLLFAQGALVAEACLRLDASPRAAFSTSQMDGCDMGTTNPNACLFGYLEQTDQSGAQPTVPPVTQQVVLVAETAAHPIPFAHAASPPPGCAPPIPIRFCTLLI